MNSSPPEQPGTSFSRRLWLLLLSRKGIAIGVVILSSMVGGTLWLRHFILNELSPWVEATLTEQFQRPVQLGNIERFSWNSVRVGPSALPPTVNDPDSLRLQALEVQFNPLQLLLTRTLKLDITAERPTVHLEQDKDEQWVQISLQPPHAPTELLKTEVQSVQIRNASVELVPNSKPGQRRSVIALEQVYSTAHIFDNSERIRFQVRGQPTTGGRFDLKGEWQQPTQSLNLVAQGQDLAVASLDRLLRFPINLRAGRGGGNLTVKLRPQQPPSLVGVAEFQAVTLQIPGVPQPFTQASGQLRFQDQAIALEQTSGHYGQIPAQIQGTIHPTQGFNLRGQVKSVNLTAAQKTLAVQLPFPTSGNVSVDLRLNGALGQPILRGIVRSIGTAQVDKLAVSHLSARFRLAHTTLALSDIQILPTLGGAGDRSGAGYPRRAWPSHP
ncbi:DUF3971 domain-containing protein [Neosynechococcus sphagnicola]|uniref:DUF3971 domain-containing protein n=1 Tax=Neosynechococcus sphagnicola TaxID=1501145 RepID=UPI0012E064F5|nr:DUF3971 domain-containing protein [Neosynechococcus sphagnicola]